MEGFSEVYFAQLQTNPAMIDYLRSLKGRGIRLAMLTNNVAEWEPRWRSMLPVDEIFELVVDSAFVGMRKPEPEIYELTLERMGLTAAECVFVDDIDINCEAASALGMTGVHFVSAEQAIAEIEAALGGDCLARNRRRCIRGAIQRTVDRRAPGTPGSAVLAALAALDPSLDSRAAMRSGDWLSRAGAHCRPTIASVDRALRLRDKAVLASDGLRAGDSRPLDPARRSRLFVTRGRLLDPPRRSRVTRAPAPVA